MMRPMGAFDVSRQLLRNWKKKPMLQKIQKKRSKAGKRQLQGMHTISKCLIFDFSRIEKNLIWPKKDQKYIGFFLFFFLAKTKDWVLRDLLIGFEFFSGQTSMMIRSTLIKWPRKWRIVSNWEKKVTYLLYLYNHD